MENKYFYGVFAACTTKKILKESTHIKRCLKCEIDFHHSKNIFCPNCGTKTINKNELTDEVKYGIVMQRIKDRLWCCFSNNTCNVFDDSNDLNENTHYYHSNIKHDKLNDCQLKELEYGFIDMYKSRDFIDNEINVFKQLFKNEIEILEKEYGKDNVKFLHGLVVAPDISW